MSVEFPKSQPSIQRSGDTGVTIASHREGDKSSTTDAKVKDLEAALALKKAELDHLAETKDSLKDRVTVKALGPKLFEEVSKRVEDKEVALKTEISSLAKRVSQLKVSVLPQDKTAKEGVKTSEAVVMHANINAEFRRDQHRAQIFEKLSALGVPENEREQNLDLLMKYIQGSKPTLNFDATDLSRLERFDKLGRLENIWDAPEGTFSQDLTEKRDKVERGMHGYASGYGKQIDAKERPFYMGVNLGNGRLGAAPYYGKSYFQAKESVYNKATLSAGDSFNDTFAKANFNVGTSSRLEGVLANASVDNLEKMLQMAKGEIPPQPLPGNEYIEAQVFDVQWEDIGKLVLSRAEIPKGSEAESKWVQWAESRGIEVEFFDSAAWEKAALEGGIHRANSLYEPTPLNEEPVAVTNPTQEHINTFLKQMHLKNIPGEVSLGLRDLKQAISEYTATVNDTLNKVPSPNGGGVLRDLLAASTPYARNYAFIQKFTLRNQDAFKKYTASLPDEKAVLQARKKIEDFETKLRAGPPSEQGEKKLDKMKADFETIKAKAFLRKRIGDDNLEILMSNPVTHSRQYSMLVESLRHAIDKKDASKAVSVAKEMKAVELEYSRRLNVLSEVMSDPSFRAKAHGRNKNMEIIAKQAKTMAYLSEGTVALFSNVAKSVEVDPEGWIQSLSK